MRIHLLEGSTQFFHHQIHYSTSVLEVKDARKPFQQRLFSTHYPWNASGSQPKSARRENSRTSFLRVEHKIIGCGPSAVVPPCNLWYRCRWSGAVSSSLLSVAVVIRIIDQNWSELVRIDPNWSELIRCHGGTCGTGAAPGRSTTFLIGKGNSIVRLQWDRFC